jgi:uncharacterized protein YndB with AHSA1/START domain
MSHRVEKIFTVAAPIERAWAAFAVSAERSNWEADVFEIDPVPGGKVHWELPGLTADGEVLDAEPLRLLRHTERSGPHANTEITVTFAGVDGGTRISITHSGFGTPGVDDWFEGTSLGWDEAIADLCCYLTTGVAPRRFNVGMRSPGMFMHDTPAGVVVSRVHDTGLAADAGLENGDLLVRVAAVPIFSISDLWVLMRQFDEGHEIDVEYVRASTMRRGAGALTNW